MEDKRDILHDEGIEFYEQNNFKTLFTLPTGTGKSVITIKLLKKYPGKYLLVTPTILLHKRNWKAEFEKHSSLEMYDNLTRCCYVSLHKYDLNEFDGIIFDEAHHLSVRQYNLLRRYLHLFKKDDLHSKKVIALTATPGKYGFTQRVLREIVGNAVFNYKLDEAADNQMVNNFKIHVIYTKLDNITKNSKAGSKEKPFLTTEKSNYDYLTKVINELKEEIKTSSGMVKYLSKYQMYIRKRAKLLYDLQSKILSVKKFLIKLDNEQPNIKTVIFARTIDVAEKLEKHSIHSKSKEDFIAPFIEGKINRISSVDMLLEGMNLSKVEIGIMTSPPSERKFIQSLGRCLRNDVDKISHYYIFCVKDTVEEDWLKTAIEDISQEKIIYEN
jgi:superfamily II DNA or RNA helicase